MKADHLMVAKKQRQSEEEAKVPMSPSRVHSPPVTYTLQPDSTSQRVQDFPMVP